MAAAVIKTFSEEVMFQLKLVGQSCLGKGGEDEQGCVFFPARGNSACKGLLVRGSSTETPSCDRRYLKLTGSVRGREG